MCLWFGKWEKKSRFIKTSTLKIQGCDNKKKIQKGVLFVKKYLMQKGVSQIKILHVCIFMNCWLNVI